MELKKALEHGYKLVAKDNMSEFYSNIDSEYNSHRGKQGYLFQYVNGEFSSMIYITKDLIKQIYNNTTK